MLGFFGGCFLELMIIAMSVAVQEKLALSAENSLKVCLVHIILKNCQFFLNLQ